MDENVEKTTVSSTAVTVEELTDALKLIRKVCKANRCQTCQLRDSDGDCNLQEIAPDGWVFRDEESTKPLRVFQ